MTTTINSCLFFLLMFSIASPVRVDAQASEIVFVLAPTDLKNKAKVQMAKDYNTTLKEVIADYWDLDMSYQFMQEKAAYKYSKSAKGIVVGEFETLSQINGIRSETKFNFRDGKNQKKLLSVRLPVYGFGKVDMIYAIMHSQFMYTNLTKFKNPTKELPKVYGHILKEKTLLFAKSNLSNRFSADDLSQVYPYKFKVVSAEEISKAIVNKDEQHLVLYKASESGNVTEANYPYWNIYQPKDGVVIARHGGGSKTLTKADVELFVKRTK